MAKTRLQEATEQRFSRFEEAYEQRFSRFEEKIDQRFSRLEEMMAALGVSRKQNQADQRESFTKPQVIQENDDRSPLDRYSPSSQKVENEVATELIETKQGIVKPEAKANVILANLEEEPISQLQVPVSKLEPSLPFRNASPDVCEDFKSIVGFDGLFDHVKARNELVSKSTSMTNNQVAHQLFDEIPLRKRILPKEHKKRFQKCWRFKFKYKAPLRRRQFLHHLDNEVPIEINWNVQRIWNTEYPDVGLTYAYSVLQEEFEQIMNHTLFSVIKLEGLLLLGDESFQIKHKWRFKLLPLILECELYSDRLVLVTNYAQQFDISVSFSTNLEVKVSSKGEDLI